MTARDDLGKLDPLWVAGFYWASGRLAAGAEDVKDGDPMAFADFYTEEEERNEWGTRVGEAWKVYRQAQEPELSGDPRTEALDYQGDKG